MYETREAWYVAATAALERDVFHSMGHSLPKVRIGCGWPTGNRSKRIAECFSRRCSSDKTYEIFISPKLSDAKLILAVLVHELCHTIVGTEYKHKKPFIEVMQTVGMIKPWTQSRAGEKLALQLSAIADELGPYPHATLDIKKGGAKKQSTRLLKVVCPECGYVVRVTRKWLDEAGAPLCPIHEIAFEEEKPLDK